MLNDQDNAAKIIALAAEMYDTFTSGTRDNGDTYRFLKEGHPEWMDEINQAAHFNSEFLPNDWMYETTHSILAAIADLDESAHFDDAAHEIADSITDVYNGALTAWLALDLRFGAFCDDARDELGFDESRGIFRRIQLGQYYCISQMVAAIVSALESEAEQQGESV